jgi:hypothetical protein
LLTEGYLRGWLTFEYPLTLSRFREELVLNYVLESRLCDALEHRLMTETVLRAGFQSKNLEPIYDVRNTILGLKLPSLAEKDKINGNNAAADMEITPENLKIWKETLEAAKLKKQNNAS